MKLRSETTRADRAFNLACQLLSRAAIGTTEQHKKSIRRQILDRIEPDPPKPHDPSDGDMKATGDAAHLIGISKHWARKDVIVFNDELRERCLDYLWRSEEATGLTVDLFNLPFLTERTVKVKKVSYRVQITRLEEGLQAGCVLIGAVTTWFFAGQTELFQFGDWMNPETIRKVLAAHKSAVVSFNPTSSPLTQQAADYISKLTRKSHLRYPCIRSCKFLVSAAIINRELLTASDQLAFQLAVTKLNEWAEHWAAVHGFSHTEDFKALIRRTFGK